MKCLEPGNYIWGVPLAEWVADRYDPQNALPTPAAPAVPISEYLSPPTPPAERRQFPRVSCRIEASVADEGGSTRLPVKVTDISLGGCYVDMLSPLPTGSSIEIALETGQGILSARGKVVVSQLGMGMSVVFTGISPGDFEKLREIAPPASLAEESERLKPPLLAAAPAPASRSNGAGSAKRVSPITPTTQEVLEAILRILLRKGIVNEEELAEEFEKLLVAKS